jgi:hypothetical protein
LFLFKNKKKRRVSIVPNKRLKIGYEIKPEFSIVGSKNPANYKLMELIHSFFNGIGSRRLLSFFRCTPVRAAHTYRFRKKEGAASVNENTNMYEYKIQGFKNCLLIMQHFLAYPLMTLRWREAS